MFEESTLKVRNYFFDKFESHEFGYVLFPLLRIFKLFGFFPMQLQVVDLLNGSYKFKWDSKSLVATLIGTIVYIVGFYLGIRNLSKVMNMTRTYESSTIAYITTWSQIVFLFLFGSYALFNTWWNVIQLQRLFLWITEIDYQLEEVTGHSPNYTQMRKNLFLQLPLAFLVPSCLSMVNCSVIHYRKYADNIVVFSCCFWFVCFAPIFLLTLKEFQFYNLMFLLKTKFDIINKELLQYGGGGLFSCGEVWDILAANSPKPQCSADLIKKLLKVYANTADCVELLLKVFGWHLLLLTSASFLVITVQIYNLFAAVIVHSIDMGGYQLTIVTGWIFVQIFIICLNVGTCSMTSTAMSLTGTLLHRIEVVPLTNCSFYSIMNIFSQEVLHRKNNFSAGGFFDMDYKLLTSITAAVATYLLIIIQFHLGSTQNN